MAELGYARYGKDNVRLYKVKKDSNGVQHVTEMTVCTLLEGDIEASWTRADNASIVATDTQKQTVYIKAKEHDISTPEVFAAILGEHFVNTYSHIHACHVKIIVHRWTRLDVNGKPHPHSFFRDGAEIRTVEAVAREGQGITIKSGIDKLLVLKSTGSAFYGFHRDEFTRLPETWDRILSTEVEAAWQWKKFSGLREVQQKAAMFDKAHSDARSITFETFANENSPSVQNTMYKMSEQILAAAPETETVSYNLPNKHYFEIDLSWYKGLKNTGKDAEVYAPQSDPNGLIQCTVTRKGLAKAKL
jgi:urate oxidase